MNKDFNFQNYQVHTVPWLESIKGVFKFVENPIPVINDAMSKYGATYYTRIVGGRKIVMTSDPDVIQHVLQKNHKNYSKSELQTDSLGRYIGNGLLTANGQYWLRQRRLIQPSFYKAKLAELVDIMNAEVLAYSKSLEKRIVKPELYVNVSDEMMELTLRIVSKSLFSTGISDEQIKELGAKFTELQEFIIKEVRQPVFNWWRKYSGQTKRAHNLAEEVKDILRKVIHDRKTSGENQGDLLDMLIHSQYEDTGEHMTDQQILDEALIIFTAGHETTANALAWCIYLLSKHPEVTTKLLYEYNEKIDRSISIESLMTAEYSQMILSETMRLYPPAWILDRVAHEDDQIKNVKIGKNDLVGIYVYGTHRHPSIWENPDQFKPDRFKKENYLNLHSYAFHPFGGGPRLCIGNHFATMEMQMSIFSLMDRFTWRVAPNQNIEIQPLITLRPKNGIKMIISKRLKSIARKM